MRLVAYVIGLSLAITGCSPKYNVLGIDTDEEEEEEVEFDYSNATLRIVQPKSGSFVPYNETANFEAELLDKDGNVLELEDVTWSSSVDTAWDPTGRSFDDDSLDVGLHDLTAQIQLPNGDRLAYSVGGVLVQSVWAGTYVGTFIADVQYDEFPLGCAGSALLVIDPYGQVLTGASDCVVSVGGNALDLSFLFDVEHNGDGELNGTVAADIFGWFQFDFDAEGGIDLPEENLNISFGGNPFGDLSIDGSVSADRISLDAGL
jgi:hypothetical protein